MSAPGPWGQPRKTSRLGFYLWLGALAGVVLLIFVLDQYFPGGDSPFGDPNQVRLVGVLALASTSLLFIRDFNLKRTARNVLIWVAAGGVLVIGFSFRGELTDLALRLRSGLVPSYPVQTGSHEMTVLAGEGGSFQIYGTVNGKQIRFLIDTGASEIVLSPADARRLGVHFELLNFDRPFGSANGIGHGAAMNVQDLSVGPIHFSNVPVSINGAEMSSSLLGMTFLRRLKSYSFSGDKLVLRW
jgi:aspartyl protease family protein